MAVLRKKINKTQVLNYLKQNYRKCDIAREVGCTWDYVYKLEKRFISEGRLNAEECIK